MKRWHVLVLFLFLAALQAADIIIQRGLNTMLDLQQQEIDLISTWIGGHTHEVKPERSSSCVYASNQLNHLEDVAHVTF